MTFKSPLPSDYIFPLLPIPHPEVLDGDVLAAVEGIEEMEEEKSLEDSTGANKLEEEDEKEDESNGKEQTVAEKSTEEEQYKPQQEGDGNS